MWFVERVMFMIDDVMYNFVTKFMTSVHAS